MRNRGYQAIIRILPFLILIASASTSVAEKAPPETMQIDPLSPSRMHKPAIKAPGDDSRVRLSRPRIPRFSVASLTGGYNLALFSGGSCANCRVRVRITVKDPGADLASLVFSFNGKTLQTIRPAGHSYANDNLQLDLSGARPPRSGRYTLTVQATNVRGQSHSRSLPLSVDLERPKIVAVSPADGATLFADGPTMPLVFEVSADDDVGIANVSVIGDRLHNPRWRGVDRVRPYRVRIRDVELGARDWTVRVSDRQGNVSESRVTIDIRPRPVASP